MKTRLRTVTDGKVTYEHLLFVCQGCIAGGPNGYDGIHALPVNTEVKSPSWNWNGDLEKPTLHPSILSFGEVVPEGYSRCHSFLTDGVFNFLEDSTHSLAGQSVPLPDLPERAATLSDDDGEDDV